MLVWQITVCPDQWHSIKTNIISMWCTSRICSWSNSIYYLHVAFGWHNQEAWNAVSYVCRLLSIIYYFRNVWHPDINQTALNMEILIGGIRGWYSDNMLKLNNSKTEMMVISSKFRPSVHLDHIKIGESSISPETVRNLGVIMDSNYTMVSHINHKIQDSFPKIRELSYYRRYLTDESSKTAVHAYVTPRLDYCNSLLYGLPKELYTAKCYEYSCTTGYQNQEIWPYNSSASRSPLASYRITLQIQNSTFGI